MSLFQKAGNSGALFSVEGTISNNATWEEDIYFLEDGAGVDLTDLSFQLQFRDDPETPSALLVLSTADGDMTIENDDNSVPSILRISVPYTTISGLNGDYIADLVAKDADDKLVHYAHGVVSFKQNPVAF